MTAIAPPQPLELRATIRAEVAAASRVVAPLWPIGTFIAVNPLGGLQASSFEEAVRTARRDLGARGYPSLREARAGHASGAVTDAQLADALAEAVDGLDDLPPVAGVPAARLLLADLLHAPPAPGPERLQTVAARWDAVLGTTIAGQVDELVAAWCAAFTDEGVAGWGIPRDPGGLYATFRVLAGDDSRVGRLAGPGVRDKLRALPDDPAAAIVAALERLGVGAAQRGDELRAQLLRQPGWAGYLRWRSDWAPADSTSPPADLTDLLAVRLTCEALGVRAARDRAAVAATGLPGSRRVASAGADPNARLAAACDTLGIDGDALTADDRARALALLARLGEDDRGAIWLAARERAYRDDLLAALDRAPVAARARGEGRPAAQLVCCIDVRSEGLRRRLEALGDYETLGFAGFFAVAIRFRGLGAAAPAALCPVLLRPAVDIEERPAAGGEAAAAEALDRRSGELAFAEAFHHAKSGLASPFALAEAGGLLAGPLAVLRTFVTPSRSRRPGAWPATTVTATADEEGDPGFTTAEQVRFAHAALTMMGLTGPFARLVVLCAHGSHTRNNPYAAALDCGACGGQRGGPNARVAAAILNREPVRAALAGRGTVIPEDTWFVAAEHDTTSDAVTMLDRELVPAGHREELSRLEADLARAGLALARERAARLPGGGPAAARGRDWAQVRPEWGLAGNAAFIAGPRSMTRGLDLGCRTFLHSYRAEADPDGSALETILTAPLVVAQWINAQYYFSSVDPELFGAGDKTLHNVTGTVGVVQGGGGDLRVGLPWQSVAVGDRLQHEPLRLLAVVQAPLARIDEIVARNQVLRELFGGGWVSLAAREHDTSPWFRRDRDGRWSHHRSKEAAA